MPAKKSRSLLEEAFGRRPTLAELFELARQGKLAPGVGKLGSPDRRPKGGSWCRVCKQYHATNHTEFLRNQLRQAMERVRQSK